MDDALRQIDEEALLAQMAWVRKLAARLVRDPGLAEDLAQETLLVAVRHPPARAVSERSLRAWLSRVLGNLVRLGARSDLRRYAREAQVARPERSDSAADVVSRVSDQHLVVEAVLALDEPYRSTVLLRFFDGLSVARIATRMECTPVSVRKRLSRALSMLHARLEREFGGDRMTFGLALLAMCRAEGGFGSTLISTWGGITVGTKTMAILTCAALALALICGRMWPDGGVETTSALAPPAVTSGDPTVSSTGDSLAPASGLGEAEPIRISLATVRILQVRSATTRAPLSEAEIASCTPKSAARLQALVDARWESLGIENAAARRWLELMMEEAVPPVPFAAGDPPFHVEEEEALGKTDEEGLFELPHTPSLETGLVIRHVDGFPTLVPSACLAKEPMDAPVDVLLPARGKLLVHVIDGDGAPVEGAYVRIELDFAGVRPDAPRPLLDSLTWHGPTDRRGELRIPDLPADVGLYVTPFGEFSCRPPRARIDADSREGLAHVRIWRVGSVRGVIEYEDGEPARDLAVWFLGRCYPHDSQGPLIPTEADGGFLLRDLSAGKGLLHITIARDRNGTIRRQRPIYGAIHILPIEMPSEGVRDLGKIILPGIARIEGSVSSSTELPVFDGEIHDVFLQVSIHKQGRLLSKSYLGEQASFSYELPKGEYELVVELHGGWGSRELLRRPVSCPTRDLRIELGRVTGGLKARLPEGMPDRVAASARVFYSPDPLSRTWRTHSSINYVRAPMRAGALEFGLLPAGEYDVEISLGRLGATFLKGVVVESGQVTDLGVINLDGAEVSGMVFGSDGAPVENARIILLAPSRDKLGMGEHLRRETLSKEDGSYRLALVEARQWQVYAHIGEEPASAPTSVDVLAGGRTQLDLHLAPPCFIRGRVTRSGEPASGVEVTWLYATIPDLKYTLAARPPCLTDAEGNYLLGPMLARSYRVAVTGAGTTSGQLDLSPGEEVVLDFELAPKRTRLHVELPEGHEPWLTRITATCIDERSPCFGLERRGVFSGENEVDIGLFPTRNLLTVTLGQRPVMHAVVDGAVAEDGETVTMPNGVVELEFTAGHGHGKHPTLDIIEVPGWGIGREILSEWWGQSLPVVEDGATLRFLGIPRGARLMLVGRNESGRTVGRELTYEGPGPMRVSWP